MLRKTVIARALTLAFSTAALSVALVEPVMAQSNAAGNIFGLVDNPAGATVNLLNTDTGAKRSIAPEANGRYLVTALPPGHYKVELVRDGKVTNTTEVDVLIGQGVDASFSAKAMQSVQVTGRRSRIDVSNSNNGATFTAKELARLPIAPSVASIIQLAPNTTRADSRYSAGASFGGGGASENSYYINGFPVTNPVTQLGASELPFGAIGQAQVLTGGFGAEFGRSVGGVVNITTKSGTNTWEAGGQISWEPDSLRATYKDIYYAKTGASENSTTDGTLYRQNSNRQRTEKIFGAYVGGPLIKDKLFMFLSAEGRKYDQERVNPQGTSGIRTSASLGAAGYEKTQDKIERYMAKFDWNITDDHRVEATLIGDEGKSDRQLYAYTYPTATTGGVVGKQTGSQHYKNNADFSPSVGAEVQILRYTGNFTDDLTVTALYGQSRMPVENRYDPVGSAPADVWQITAPSNARAPGLNYSSPQVLTGSVDNPESLSKIRSARLDLEYKLANHTIRAGFDNNTLDSSQIGQTYGGGGIWVYAKANNPNAPIAFGPQRVSPASGGGLGTQGYYVSRRLFDSVTDASSKQDARYIEDRWQANKDLLVTVGLRQEGFKNINGDGETFLEVKDKLSPRFAAAWDVNGDASFKVFGSAGRYALQIPTHLAVRGASRSTLTRQAFTYTGTDQYGQPTGLVQLSNVYSVNNELGQAKDAKTVTAQDIEATYQDELTLGFEKAWSPELNFGAKVTYRKLKATIDDFCDARPFERYAAAHNINTDNWAGFSCASFNPGRDASFLVDFAGTQSNYTTVNLTKADLGFDKPKRTYAALDVFAEHPYRNGWYGKINYTLARSKGNTEGQTKSDNGQTDVAATSTWDNPELMVNAYGRLPNDRKHQIKAYGFYEVTPEWSLGGNFLAASGRPKNCLGWNPDTPGEVDYGSIYFYCDGKTVPRGTKGDLPWDVRLDMNVAYRPSFLKGLTFKVDVYNVANKQVAQNIDEIYNVSSTTDVSPTYGRVLSYTQPRSVKLSAEYNYRF